MVKEIFEQSISPEQVSSPEELNDIVKAAKTYDELVQAVGRIAEADPELTEDAPHIVEIINSLKEPEIQKLAINAAPEINPIYRITRRYGLRQKTLEITKNLSKREES